MPSKGHQSHMKLGPRFFIGATLAALLVWPSAVCAQGLALEINNGLVTLRADAVPVRQILERWGQIAGMTVINGDMLPPTLVTLQFASVPERRALETLLRDVRGYIVVRRQSGGAPIDRIVIAPATPMPSTQSMQLGQTVAAIVPAPAAVNTVDTLERAAVSTSPEDSAAQLSTVIEPPRPAPAASRRDVPPNPFGITSGSPGMGVSSPGGSADPFGTASGSSRPGTITPVQTSAPIIVPSSGGEIVPEPTK